jgi:hypothetical protein
VLRSMHRQVNVVLAVTVVAFAMLIPGVTLFGQGTTAQIKGRMVAVPSAWFC